MTKLERIIHDKFVNKTEMAKKLGISRPTLYEYIKNPDSMTIGVLRNISKYLNTDIKDIL